MPSARVTPQAPFSRRLGLMGAVGIGVGSMLGAGVFVVWGSAAAVAGRWLIAATALAAIHPVAGRCS